MTSQTQLILIGFLLPSLLCFWTKTKHRGLLFWKAKTLCGEEEETIQEGKTNPISWPFQGIGVALSLKVVTSPPKPGFCLS